MAECEVCVEPRLPVAVVKTKKTCMRCLRACTLNLHGIEVILPPDPGGKLGKSLTLYENILTSEDLAIWLKEHYPKFLFPLQKNLARRYSYTAGVDKDRMILIGMSTNSDRSSSREMMLAYCVQMIMYACFYAMPDDPEPIAKYIHDRLETRTGRLQDSAVHAMQYLSDTYDVTSTSFSWTRAQLFDADDDVFPEEIRQIELKIGDFFAAKHHRRNLPILIKSSDSTLKTTDDTLIYGIRKEKRTEHAAQMPEVLILLPPSLWHGDYKHGVLSPDTPTQEKLVEWRYLDKVLGEYDTTEDWTLHFPLRD